MGHTYTYDRAKCLLLNALYSIQCYDQFLDCLQSHIVRAGSRYV